MVELFDTCVGSVASNNTTVDLHLVMESGGLIRSELSLAMVIGIIHVVICVRCQNIFD